MMIPIDSLLQWMLTMSHWEKLHQSQIHIFNL
jgi:hypothetical protein